MSKYISLTISVFDHWLSEEEADQSGLTTYKKAKAQNILELYMIGEKKFIKLYSSISSKAICNYGSDSEIVMCCKSSKFISYLENGLRENIFPMHTIRYIDIDAIVIGGFDRTDEIIVKDIDTEKIESLIVDSGLYILEKTSLEAKNIGNIISGSF